MNLFKTLNMILLLGMLVSQIIGGCSDDDPNKPDELSLEIAPTDTTVTAGAQIQFMANVTGTNNHTVSWSMAEGPGSITSTGLYSAPTTINTASVMAAIIATLNEDITIADTAYVTILKPVQVITVTVTPENVSIVVGANQQFTATVTGTTNQGVVWSVPSGIGLINQNGVYRAPNTIVEDSVVVGIKATSIADNSKYGVAHVTVKKQQSAADAEIVTAFYHLPQLAHNYIRDLSNLCAEAVYLATELSGGGSTPVVHGTLTETSSGNYSYSPTPDNKLRWVPLNGNPTDFYIDQFTVNLELPAIYALMDDHRIGFRSEVAGKYNLTFVSAMQGSQIQSSVNGSITFELKGFNINMNQQGSAQVSISGETANYQSLVSATGTITAPAYYSTINETYSYQGNYSANIVNKHFERMANSVLIWGPEGYQLSNVHVKKAFTNDTPIELDTYWLASGVLNKNSGVYGVFGKSLVDNQIKIWLDLSVQQLILESYSISGRMIDNYITNRELIVF